MERQLFTKGYKTIIASSAENPEIEHDYLNMLIANQVDGIISGSHNLDIEEYHQITAPIVSFDRYLADNIPIVSADSYQGGQLATKYLLEHHVRRIAVMVDEDQSVSPTVNRLQGVVDYLGQQHRSFDPLDAHQADLTSVFPGIYYGVIASNDVQALEISNIYRQAGLKLNQDYFLTGYNGSRLIRQTNPMLPTVIQPIEELSAKLIDTLMARIKSPQAAVSSVVVPIHFYDPQN